MPDTRQIQVPDTEQCIAAPRRFGDDQRAVRAKRRETAEGPQSAERAEIEMIQNATQDAVAHAAPDTIADAGQVIRRGQLVAFPTETVYGLGGDATNAAAVAAIYEAKGRPAFNPLIAHVADLQAAMEIGTICGPAKALAEAFWPGPLTLVVAKSKRYPVCDLATAGLDTIAIRVPSHPVARQLLTAAGRPLAAPSANRSGHVSATTAQHVHDDLGEHAVMILDGGACGIGLESTIVLADSKAVTILRDGAITRDALANFVGADGLLDQAGRPPSMVGRPNAPGQLVSHYAPQAHVRLNARSCDPGEAFLAFGPQTQAHEQSARTINLSASADLREAAANLFAALRQLDRSGASVIAVAPVPETGLGIAINDRLRRAAAPNRQ